jgi:hypothetical protein
MNKFIAIFMYIMWTLSLIGILVVTFTNFQYVDLNVIVGVLLFFTLINTFFSVNRR